MFGKRSTSGAMTARAAGRSPERSARSPPASVPRKRACRTPYATRPATSHATAVTAGIGYENAPISNSSAASTSRMNAPSQTARMIGWPPGVDAFSTAGFSTGNRSIGIQTGLYPRETTGYPQQAVPRASLCCPRYVQRSRVREKAGGDHDPLDLARALVNAIDTRIPVGPLDPELAHVAHPAMDLDRGVGDPSKVLGREELRHRRPVRDPLAAVRTGRGVVDHQPRGMDADRGIGQHPLDRLMDGDRLPELDPRLRVLDRRLEKPLRRADGVGSEAEPAEVERAKRDLEALALGADPLRPGDPHLAEVELRGRRAVQTHLWVVRPDLETRRPAVDSKCGDPLRAGPAVERREDREHVGDRRVRDERLRALDDVRVAVALRGRLQSTGVAPRAGLRQSVRADLPCGQKLGQVACAQLVGPADIDRGAAQPGRSADHVPQRRIRARELLDRDAVAELAEALPADRFP